MSATSLRGSAHMAAPGFGVDVVIALLHSLLVSASRIAAVLIPVRGDIEASLPFLPEAVILLVVGSR